MVEAADGRTPRESIVAGGDGTRKGSARADEGTVERPATPSPLSPSSRPVFGQSRVESGTRLTLANVFDWCRHCISAPGYVKLFGELSPLSSQRKRGKRRRARARAPVDGRITLLSIYAEREGYQVSAALVYISP